MATNLHANNTSFVQAHNGAIFLSLLIPFEPKITSKTKIEANIRRLTEQAEAQMLAEPAVQQEFKSTMEQLHVALAGIDYSTTKKSLVVVVTPNSGKLYYWNLPVQEAVLITNEFPVKELVAHKRTEKEYLLLVMGDNYGGIYLGNGPRLSRLVANSPSREPLKTSYAAGSAEETGLSRAVRHIDNALTILLRSYRYPVFVIAPTPYLHSFRQISQNAGNAAALIEANPHGNDARLQQLMAPFLADWQSLKEKGLVQQLEQHLQRGKLAVGITDVWTATSEKRGRVLVVEEDYGFPAYLDQKNGTLYADTIPINKEAHRMIDAVAAAMEKVLADGGNVEIVRKGVLADYVHIALMCY